MIEIKNLSKNWKRNGNEIKSLSNISLSIKKGDFISIIGPSGCGKTTLLKLIAGLIQPSKGEILTNEISNKRNSIKKLSIVFQDPILLPWRNIYDNIKLPIELGVNVSEKNIISNLKLVGLEKYKNSFPNELSGGMKQRVSLARALISNPKLLLMDEPFGALDEINRDKLNLELLKIYKKIKPTIIFITHSISEAIFLSNKIVILGDNPTKIKDIVDIKFSKKRNLELKETKKFLNYKKCIRKKLN